MFMLSFIFLIHVIFRVKANMCRFRRWIFSYQEMGWDLIYRINPAHVCVTPKTGPRFQTSYAGVYFVFSELR